MSRKKKEETNLTFGGMNIFMTLELIFLTLKLAGLVTWSWWFVFTPLIAELVLAIFVGIIVVLIASAMDK